MIDIEVDPMAAADAAWRAHAERKPNGQANDPLDLPFTIASTLAGRTPAERPWQVPGWLPRRQVTLLSGDGGTGKSLVSMQLQIAAASTTKWLGLPTLPCRSFAIYAEDDDDELERRLNAIAIAENIDIGGLHDMAWRCVVTDPCELVDIDDRGRVAPTAYFRWLERAVTKFCARLVILDAATNLYGGDEIRRRQVNGFIMLLRQLAIAIDGTVLLLAHPSAHGMSSGSGLSGSTHWHNAVRSRLYFTSTTGDDADPDERRLERPKANYAARGEALRVKWDNGRFVPIEPPGSLDRVAVSAKAERVFLSLLSTTHANGTWTCPNPAARNYAPATFAKHPDRDGLGKPAFEAAMHRLLKTEQIKVEQYGRPAEPRSRLALA